jgi:hypothetical protein
VRREWLIYKPEVRRFLSSFHAVRRWRDLSPVPDWKLVLEDPRVERRVFKRRRKLLEKAQRREALQRLRRLAARRIA